MAGCTQKIGTSQSKQVHSLRIFAALATIATVFAAPSLAQHPHPKHKEDFKRQVEKLEETWRTAQLNDDVETMDRLLSDDYIGITMNGQVLTKTQQLDRMRARTLTLNKIDLDDVKVKLIGQTAIRMAIVTSRADVEGSNDGELIHGTYRYTRVYTRSSNGSWKITNFEATRVGTPPPRVRGMQEPATSDGGLSPAQQKWAAGTGDPSH